MQTVSKVRAVFYSLFILYLKRLMFSRLKVPWKCSTLFSKGTRGHVFMVYLNLQPHHGEEGPLLKSKRCGTQCRIMLHELVLIKCCSGTVGNEMSYLLAHGARLYGCIVESDCD
mmetsp:Transcript_1656/g.10168  ORF Transcript_1656/g.10168 Transcript_1656/m.10168 type:complete len:114 (+) Transcript_1656:1513-1854(+)